MGGGGGGQRVEPGRSAAAAQGTRLAAHLPSGTRNYNGQSVFSVVPVDGIIDPGKTQDFTVTFSPDHESRYFSDRLQVVLFGKVRLQQPSLDPSSRVSGTPLAFLGCPPLEALALPGGSGPGRVHQVESPVSRLPRAPTLLEPRSQVLGVTLLWSLSPENLPPDSSEGRGP